MPNRRRRYVALWDGVPATVSVDGDRLFKRYPQMPYDDMRRVTLGGTVFTSLRRCRDAIYGTHRWYEQEGHRLAETAIMIALLHFEDDA